MKNSHCIEIPKQLYHDYYICLIMEGDHKVFIEVDYEEYKIILDGIINFRNILIRVSLKENYKYYGDIYSSKILGRIFVFKYIHYHEIPDIFNYFVIPKDRLKEGIVIN